MLTNATKCLLIGFNSRYESSTLNTKLRKRYLQGDFEVLSLSSGLDLTFPVSYLDLTTKKLIKIAEGNDIFCQTFINSNTLILTSSNIYTRQDSTGILKSFQLISKKIKQFNKKTTTLKTVNVSVNEAGVKYLNNFKPFSEHDLTNSYGVYFLNDRKNNLNIDKILNLKLLNYTTQSNTPTFCFEQNNGKLNMSNNLLLNSLNSYSYINLPNNSFFESKGTFLNTEGLFKKTIKFVNLNNQTKDDWQIIRKLFLVLSKLTFLQNSKNNFKLSFNSSTLNKFNLFTGFMYVSSKCLTNKTYTTENNKISANYSLNTTNKLNHNKFKITNSKLKLWINDFYIGGKDSYSKYSNTMINCSKSFRSEKLIFQHII